MGQSEPDGGVFALMRGAEPLAQAEPLTRVPVYRDLPGGARLRWVFGTCRYRSSDGDGIGVYDRADLLA
jgi:hypothetical protein